MVEKNPEMNMWDFKDEKKKKKKKKEHFLPQKTSINLQNQQNPSSKKSEQKMPDKHEKIIGAGSNFSIINPEVGVNITEEKK